MSRSYDSGNPLVAGIEEIRSSWGWFLVFGIVLMALGVACIIADATATLATVLVFGWLLLFGGIVSFIQAFHARNWHGFLLFFLSALLRGFTGYLLIRYPTSGAVGLTMMLASFFVVGGLFRAIGSAALKFPRWGWSAFSGLVSFVLGVLLLAQLPISGVWFIGFAIGVEMIVDGSSLVAIATAIHSLPTLPELTHRAA